MSPDDFDVVGVYERERSTREAFKYPRSRAPEARFSDLETMLNVTRPDAVAAFGSIYEHLEVVEKCAPLGIHVMVEKPLAISVEHGDRIASLAREHGIHVLTNYETSWYPTTAHAFAVLESGAIGSARKVLVRDGHGGPIETGCRPEFLSWLTDPAFSGGGALSDFGCYGANLLTRLMQGELPVSITALSRSFKPALYPLVEDDALIVLNYEMVEGVIQASWNWPAARKDMEINGTTGFVRTLDAVTGLELTPKGDGPVSVMPAPLPSNVAGPFAHLAAVIRGDLALRPFDLSALENNVSVVRILDAARRSAALGQTVSLANRAAAESSR